MAKPKIIYGITDVDSEGYAAGNETYTSLYATREKALEEAYKCYFAAFNGLCGDNGVDANGSAILSKEQFFEEMLNEDGGNFVLIQLYDSHRQFEYFERELID